MAKITDYPSITTINANTVLLADGSSGTGKILASNMAKYAIETYTGSTLAGSAQSVKSAVNALNEEIIEIDPTLTQSGKAADAKKTGDGIADLKSDLKFVSPINIVDESKILTATISGTVINASPSNKTAVVPCLPATAYKIQKAVGQYFQVGFSQTEPGVGSTITNKYNFGTDTEGIVVSSSDANYMAVWFYNAGDETSLEDAINSLFICDDKYENASADAITLKNIAKEGIPSYAIEGLESLLKPADNNDLYTEYYATIKNPSGIDYNDQVAQIKVNFERGECRKSNNIVLLDENNNEIPFQFEGCIEDNGLYDDNLTLWNDGTIKCGTIWFYTSINTGETKEFRIRVYSSKTHGGYSPIVTNDYPVEARNIIVTSGNKNYYFYGVGDTGYKYLRSLNGDTNFRCQSRFKYNNATTYFRDYCSFESMTISGSGVVYKDVDIVHDCDMFKFHEQYRIFKNRFTYTTSVVTKNTISSGTIGNMLFAIQLGVTNADKHSSYPFEYAKITYNNETCYASVIYSIGNIPRSDTYNTIPNFVPYANVLSANGYRQIICGWDNSDLTTPKDIPKDFVFGGKIDIMFGYENGDTLQINPLVSFASKITKEKITHLFSETCKPHLIHTSLNVIANYEHDNYDMDMWAKYCVAKYTNKLTLQEVIAEYKQHASDRGLTTATGIMAKWQSGMGVEFLSRYLPLAYYLSLEVTGSDNEYFKNIIKESGKFFSNVFETYGDIPLSYSRGVASANNNARCGALHNISLAIYLGENLNDSYASLLNVIHTNSAYGTMLPEGSLSKSRYTHYMSFAYFDYVMANHYTKINNDLVDNGCNFMLDCCLPSGEVKDQEFNPATARRGVISTYAYIIASLMMSDEYYNMNAAYTMLKWVEKQDSPVIPIVYPLDRYSADYTGTETASVAMFEVPPLLQILQLKAEL